MSGLLDSIMQQLGGDTMRGLGQRLGTDDDTASRAVQAALPALVGALARNAQSAEGATSLAGALDRDHDGQVLDDLPGLLSGGGNAGILKHVFGGRQGAIESGLGAASGLNGAQAGQLLALLAPIVLGALGRAKRTQGLDSGGLASMLGKEKASLPAPQAGGLGALLQLLDQDRDGSVVDDIGSALGKMMGR